MRRITKAALGGIAGCALVLGGTQVASGVPGAFKFQEALMDLLTAEPPGPFDSARAKTTITQTADPATTTFTMRVTGIDPSVAGREFAAHLHVGPCDNSGPHYKDNFLGAADDVNGAWLAVVPNEDGMALSETTVLFVPDDTKPEYEAYTPGEMSIVIHQGPLTSPSTKQACFPLSVSGIFPKTE
jgi:superoxide dismutase, Cu-Zn family